MVTVSIYEPPGKHKSNTSSSRNGKPRNIQHTTEENQTIKKENQKSLGIKRETMYRRATSVDCTAQELKPPSCHNLSCSVIRKNIESFCCCTSLKQYITENTNNRTQSWFLERHKMDKPLATLKNTRLLRKTGRAA